MQITLLALGLTALHLTTATPVAAPPAEGTGLPKCANTPSQVQVNGDTWDVYCDRNVSEGTVLATTTKTTSFSQCYDNCSAFGGVAATLVKKTQICTCYSSISEAVIQDGSSFAYNTADVS